ncbi:mitogen-activated protein kinase kinase kinase 14 [Coregonus clupeaformis]|uniref:mitogen-activated protein kinase kinase kinase 14 n=1 Tax=Coregonus clupeaformis TaxID=59861 RepID=UPI001E1C2ABF|nr:mitogen-activated protein kinase kinase kinase 14 [Coregonus clupeaformis]
MAIPKMFEVKGVSLLFSLGEENIMEGEENKDPLVQTVLPSLSLVMEQGTAKQVGTEGHGDSDQVPCVSIIAQAEGEGSQEFSPTSTACVYSRSHLLKSHRSIAKKATTESDTDKENYVGTTRTVPHHHIRRKLRRKPQEGRQREEEQEPPVIQGLWVQEIDWSKSTNKDMSWASEVNQLPVDLPKHTDSIWVPHRRGGCSLDTVFELVSHCSLEGVSKCADGLSDIYELMGVSDSSSESGGMSESPCSLKSISDSESIRTHESESDSSCSFGDGGLSDSVCSLVDVSDCLSSVMCVSDNFLAPEGASDSNSSCNLMGVSDSDSTCSRGWESGSSSSVEGASNSFCNLVGVSNIPGGVSGSLCSVGGVSDSETMFEELRSRVTQKHQRFVSPFFKALVKDVSDEMKEFTAQINEGLIFHKQLQPNKFEYREGKEYHILYHIQNGSYGDVFSVQDKSTGFKCAAKKIPLSHFNCEEVSTWSALNSPGVVKLFGAVREGPYVTLFMDLKTGCLAQLLRERGSLPEELALRYLCQLLGALEHLHHRHVLHLDVKVDNVLLSEDGRDTFLCDFGLSETLDPNGQSTKAFRLSGWPAGTETHMAPEVARGDLRCAKADVWSSCCMLLHMLNGCHPWIRYYNHPLCFKIVNEPPPLREVPPSCNPYTAEVLRAGLQKDPASRASARALRQMTTKALRAVGGLCHSSGQGHCQKLVNSKDGNHDRPYIPSAPAKPAATQSAPKMHWVSPWRALAAEADSSDSEEGGSELERNSESVTYSLEDRDWEYYQHSLEESHVVEDWEYETDSEVDIYLGEDGDPEKSSVFKKGDCEYEGDWEEEESSTELYQALHTHFPVLRKGLPEIDQSWGSEPELEYLRDGVTVGILAQTPSPEPRDHPPSCMSSTGSSHKDDTDTDKDSDCSSDDLSSGVFSYNSQTDGQSFNLEWLVVSTNQPPSYCFEGIEIWIENIGGECLRIRERRQVKVGHVAIGISEQITVKAFSLETLDRKPVSFQQEIQESGLWLCCIPAPDCCPRWSWRIKEGKLEIRE